MQELLGLLCGERYASHIKGRAWRLCDGHVTGFPPGADATWLRFHAVVTKRCGAFYVRFYSMSFLIFPIWGLEAVRWIRECSGGAVA
jgi:hypothetical protein